MAKFGKFRTSQNWVGDCDIQDALYVPPAYEEVEECMTDFEQFVENERTDTPEVVKLAILHYQFETIHPFVGGNGRIGRMIIPLYLQSKGMLDKSCLYLSEYLESHKDKYFDMLTRVRNSSDIIGWIKFFLTAVIESAKVTKERFENLTKLKEEIETVIDKSIVKPETVRKAIDVLYSEGVVDGTKIGELAGIKESTMRTIVNEFIDKEVIVKTKGNNKSKVLIFQKYLDIILN